LDCNTFPKMKSNLPCLTPATRKSSRSRAHFFAAPLLLALIFYGANFAFAQTVDFGGGINGDDARYQTDPQGGNKKHPPKPTPTPSPQPTPTRLSDGETDWKNVGGTDWNTGANWTAVSGSAPPAAGDVAWFKTVFSSGQPNLSASTSIAGLNFSAIGVSGYDITSSSTSIKLTLTATGASIGTELGNTTAVAIAAQNTSGTNTIDAPIILGAAAAATQTIIQASGGTLVINGVISEANAGINLSLSGAGKVTFAGANTYTGTTTISGGTLQLGNGGTTGSLSTSSAIVDNGNLTINRSNAVTQGTDFSGSAITGSGSFTQAGAGTTTLNAANTYSGDTTVSAGTLNLGVLNAIPSGAGKGNVIDNGTITMGTLNVSINGLSGSGIFNSDAGNAQPGRTLTIGNNNANGNFSGIIQQTGGHGLLNVIKTGSGTQVLSGANNYLGTTTVNGGTLLVNGNQSSATGAVTVNNSGTVLGGTGTIGGAVTVNGLATITAATNGTTGALTLSSDLTLTGTSGNLATYLVDLTAITSDKLAITGNLNLHSMSNAFDQISFQGTTGASSYILATFGSLTGTFGTVTNLPSGYHLVYNATDIELDVVPEPGTWLAGALVFGSLLATQRRHLARLLKRTA
jgi:fibronectin-binding autotransporter adhesin